MKAVLVALLVDDRCGDPAAALRSVHRFSDPTTDIRRVVLADNPATDGRAWQAPHPCGVGVLRSTAVELARQQGVDHLLLLRADGAYPENLVRALVSAVSADPAIAVASPWRTDLGAFGFQRAASADGRHDQDQLSRWLQVGFGPAGLDVPIATDASVLLVMRHLQDLGSPDVALESAGCWDLALRARRSGLRAVLAPGCLVQRGAAPGDELALGGAEALIVRRRFPLLPVQLDAVTSSGAVERLRQHAIVTLAREAARTSGWTLDVRSDASASGSSGRPGEPDIVVRLQGDRAAIEVAGFRATIPVEGEGPPDEQVAALLGRPPVRPSRAPEVPA